MHDALLTIDEFRHDDALIAATRADRQPRVAVYRLPQPVVVLGKGSRVEREIHAGHCAADGVAVQRRAGGGCAVVIDPGNLIISVTLPSSGLGGNRARFERISQWLIDALAECGVPGVVRAGTSDLAIGDRKISGSCIHQTRDLVYYSGTLLVAPDVAAMARWLLHPPREPDYRRGRSHADFVTGVGRFLPDAADATAELLTRLARVLPARIGEVEPAV